MSQSFTSPRDLQAHYEAQFDVDVAAGKYAPLTLPLVLAPIVVAFIYFLIPHRQYPRVYQARYVIYSGLVAYVTYINLNFHCKHVATAFAHGLVLTWILLWLGVMMLVHDPQAEFKRVVWGEKRKPELKGLKNGHVEKNDSSDNATSHNETSDSNSTTIKTVGSPDMEQYYYKWQSYPLKPFSARLLWVTDLLLNFRAVAWNFNVSGSAPPPKTVQEELQYYSKADQEKFGDRKVGSDGKRGHTTRKELVYHNMRVVLIGYLKLDLLKVVLLKDRFFWGFTDAGPPAYFPTFVAENQCLVRWYRLISTMIGVWSALETILSTSPLVFSGLLGPKWLGAHAEPWVYPDVWGVFSRSWDRGLAGFWGSFWHQTFRFVFDAPSKPVLKALGIPQKSTIGLFIRTLIAFVVSGVLHSMGSFTSAGNSIDGRSRPLTGSFFFFFLQVGGVMTEQAVTTLLHQTGISRRTPKIICQSVQFWWVYLWMYYTAPLLARDFARAGVWLIEPCPISPLRALGLGVEGDSWWTWGPPDQWIFYHNSGKWWTSGFYL